MPCLCYKVLGMPCHGVSLVAGCGACPVQIVLGIILQGVGHALSQGVGMPIVCTGHCSITASVALAGLHQQVTMFGDKKLLDRGSSGIIGGVHTWTSAGAGQA